MSSGGLFVGNWVDWGFGSGLMSYKAAGRGGKLRPSQHSEWGTHPAGHFREAL
jgi:hypothetical protein